MKEHTLLAVVGCHRSGTSAVAGALAHLGWHLGPDLMPPSPDNPKGYYESMPMVRLHEAELARLGSTWDTAERLRDEWAKGFAGIPARLRAREVLRRCREAITAGSFALKDPRLCLFRPLWSMACQAEGVTLKALLVYRDTHAVVQSLCKRDKFKVEHAKRIVERHHAGMADWMEHVPCGAVEYERLLEDWHSALGVAFSQLGFPLAMRNTARAVGVDTYLDGGLNHEQT